MSQKSEKVLEDLLQSDDDIDFETARETLSAQLNVAQKTAGSYIYTSSLADVKKTANGQRLLTQTDDGNDTDDAGESSNTEDTDDTDKSDDGDDVSQTAIDAVDAERSPGQQSGSKFEFLTKLNDSDHPLIPDVSSYYRRQIAGRKTDVQVVTHALSSDTAAGVQDIILTGLPGVGKNRMVEYIASETNRPLVRIPCSRDIRYEDVVGHYSPDGNGGFEWEDGLLTMAMRYGWIVVLDEINMMPGDISSAVHQVTEDADSRKLVIRQTGEVVKPDDRFRVVATKNPLGHAGTKRMNEAFKSRFAHIEIPHLPPQAEKRVVMSQTDGLDESDESDIEKAIEVVNEFRDEYKDGSMTLAISTRELLKVADFISDDFLNLETAFEMVVGSMLPEEDQDAFSRVIEYKF